MKYLKIVVLISVIFFAFVIQSFSLTTMKVGEEMMTSEQRGIVLMHFLNLTAERGNSESALMSYSQGENIEMFGFCFGEEDIHTLTGFVLEGSPAVLALRSDDDMTSVVFIDHYKDKKWERSFCSTRSLNGWAEKAEERKFKYSAIKGNEISRMMDKIKVENEKSVFSFIELDDKIFLAYGEEEIKLMISFANEKIPTIFYEGNAGKEDDLEYAEVNFGFDEHLQCWVKIQLPRRKR